MPASAAALRIRRVTDPADPALEAFGRIQTHSYYAPDQLIPPQMFPDLVAGRRPERRDRILVAERGGEVVGGTVYHLLPAAGFNSFMGVSAAARGLGTGRLLQQASLADVAACGLPGMFADSVYAGRQTAADRAAEARAGTDPQARRAVLGRLGFRVVDLGYWQPVGGPDGGPVQDLDLLYAPLVADGDSATAPATVPLALVTATLGAYWGGWLGEARTAQELAALRERASGEHLALLDAAATPRYWGQPRP
ncbi:GNAT family N-acetyltransferase [Deinococcus lacus]|uniref:GNAT family N-acetyltransferase n=1 Tax=Deinococcus lacus TaxID=392561 RepID=A0ABW1YDV7_9DEIO